MDHETINLVGGPCDGETRHWDGGDYLQVEERKPVKFSSRLNASQRVSLTTHLYRRERGTGTFLHQSSN